MSDDAEDNPESPNDAHLPARGERIAKRLSRAGIASRRDAERMIAEGRVRVNGVAIATPAVIVTAKDRIEVDGNPVAVPEPARLWLYHKPAGLVTSARDEKGRATVFERLPEDLPRVMPIGRLDLTSEGLLLLTNDGGLKRRLELPSTGWLRKYRVRVKGTPEDRTLEPLRSGITIDGERFQPMTVTVDRQQGANAWLTVALREGRNREIRRAMEAVGLVVNRLIRVSYGPFRLAALKAGEVEEVRQKVLRDQLGMDSPSSEGTAKAKPKPGGKKPRAAPTRTSPARESAARSESAGTDGTVRSPGQRKGPDPDRKSGATGRGGVGRAGGPGPHPSRKPGKPGPRRG